MGLGAGLMAGGSVLGGLLGGKGAKKAAKAEIEMGREALALQKQMFDQTRADFAPWREKGAAALGQAYGMLQPGYDYKTSPGYQFRFGEGQRAVETSNAAHGLYNSGGNLKDLMRFGDGLASQDFGDQFNRLSQLSGMGSAATGATANSASNFANAGGNILQNIGQAKASGYAGQNQALQGTLGNLASIFGMGGFGG